MKKFLKITLAVLLIAALAAGGLYVYRQSAPASSAASASAAGDYQPVSIVTGTLNKTITGTGSVAIKQTQQTTAAFPVTLSSISVKAGDRVAKGDVIGTVDQTALKTTIAAINTSIDDIDASIVTLARSLAATVTETTAVGGRVKITHISKGKDIQEVMDKYDCLFVLSLDGKMRVTIDAGKLKTGNTVTCMDGTTRYTGTVVSVDGGKAIITFVDTVTLPGASINVLDASGVSLGMAKAAVNMPYYYRSAQEGVITVCYARSNVLLSRGGSVFTVSSIPMSEDYTSYMAQRAEALSQLKLAKAALSAGNIVADTEGIISSVDAQTRSEVATGGALYSLYVGSAKEMTISVDELDIINVSVGQTASIAMDAISDKTYDATVTYISQIGTASGGVTNYQVTLSIDGDDRLKIGMNGTATVEVGQVDNAVLVPVLALNTSKAGDYVWLQSDADIASGEPGVKTFITTGLSNDTYAQVLSGLSAGDKVMLTRSDVSTYDTMRMAYPNVGSTDALSLISGTGGVPSGGGTNGNRPSGNFGGSNGGTRTGGGN